MGIVCDWFYGIFVIDLVDFFLLLKVGNKLKWIIYRKLDFFK